METHIPITSLQCIELLKLAVRLTPDEFEERRHWLAILTDPKFDIAQLPEAIGEVDVARESDAEEQSEPEMPQLPQYPPVGQVFSMTMDGDAPENNPNQMAMSNHFPNLKHNGDKQVEGRVTKNFEFVEIGFKTIIADVRTELAKHGKIPEGQWRETAKKNFRTNGRPMGVADTSWFDPSGFSYFPFVDGHNGSGFRKSIHAFLEHWLWLIEVK